MFAFVLEGFGYAAIGWHLDGVQLSEQVGIHAGILVDTLGMVRDERTEGVGMEQLVNQTVLRAHLDNIERNGGRHTHHKGLFRHGNLVAHLVDGGAIAEHLDDGVVVVTINGAYTAHTEDLTTLDTHLAQGALYAHYLYKTSHVKHVVNVGINLNEFEILILFG